MKILLVRPNPGNETFGLGPFFRVEPLGLQYLAAAVRNRGHETVLVDERFDRSAATWARRLRPRLVGISVPHALELELALGVARAVRRELPETFIVVGGAAPAAYSLAMEIPEIDAICLGDGEAVFPALVEALETGRPLAEVPGLRLRTPDGWTSTPEVPELVDLNRVPLPARELVRRYRNHYHCVQVRPVWLVETARGCPFRCSFCAVWKLHRRSFRERSVASVVEDFAQTGENVFVVDDLFWHHEARSLELAEALKHRSARKHWILVQSRTDVVARHAELLEAWRPVARHFDIFFGFEGASDRSLRGVEKDSSVAATLEAIEVARSMGYGITGNFLVDPDWSEQEFQELWDFVARHRLNRVGYTVLTPLPGTDYFQSLAPALDGQPWHKYDMSHVLWEPRLGVERFFELYAETWKRSVLNTAGEKRWSYWLKQVKLRQIPFLVRVLRRTQTLMDADAYLREHAAGPAVRPLDAGPREPN
ncbi:MAG: radical SAM protein [Syntrophobacteraceae bacterium]